MQFLPYMIEGSLDVMVQMFQQLNFFVKDVYTEEIIATQTTTNFYFSTKFCQFLTQTSSHMQIT